MERPRINACLDVGLHCKLTLVTAPAGFGKTTAVAQWAGQKDFSVVWLSLDINDNDPVRFWTYMAAALRGLQTSILGHLSGPLCEAGLEILRRNLALGRENGYLRSFVDEGAPMLALLRRLARSRPVDGEDYLRQLSALLRVSPVLCYSSLHAVSEGCESFTVKELAVLRLMATGLDRRSIAGELGVALPTVKTHLANIYGKLGATGHRDAVERARQQGILQ